MVIIAHHCKALFIEVEDLHKLLDKIMTITDSRIYIPTFSREWFGKLKPFVTQKKIDEIQIKLLELNQASQIEIKELDE